MNISRIVAHAAVVLTIHGQLLVAQTGVDDPQLTEFATRVGQMVRQVKAAGKVAPGPKGLKALQAEERGQDAIQRLIKETDGDLEVHLRPGHQTVMQLRGRALASPAKGGLHALAQSHEHTARKFFAANRALMRLEDPDQELALARDQRDELGHRHLRFGQLYKGVPVWPAELSAHFDHAGSLTLVDGAYIPTPELDSVKPALSEEEAVARAKTAITEKGSASNIQLIIYGPLRDRPRLAWKFELTASLLDTWLVVVDAQDGAILHQSTLVFDANVQGSGVDLFGTTRTLNVWQQGDTYFMIDASKPSYNAAFDPIANPRGVIIIGDAKGASLDQVTQTATADLVTSTMANAWPVPASVSAAFNFSEVYDYFRERHQRNSLDGQGGNVTAFVGVGGYDNACWISSLGLMLFGDTRPFAGSLDVVGHELAHGVTSHSAGLPHTGQPGALNEALSDILGEMVEARTRGRNDWVLGSELGLAIRNLKDPAALIKFDRPYPAKMSDYRHDPVDRDHDWGGVHVNSTIVSHAFYLLAEGLNGAIGLRSAESIVYRCQTQHLFPQSEFVDFRLGCVASAEELFGKDSTEARMTAQAFDAVEVFATPRTPEPTPIPTVTGPDSTLFVYYDVWQDQYNLGRREAAQGDTPVGTVLANNVKLARPAVTGDGEMALFVSPDSDLCAVNTADSTSRLCLGYSGLVHSVAISPDANFVAFVLRDKDSGAPEGKITVIDLAASKQNTHNLVAPIADGLEVDTVLFADSMTFSTDGTTLIYDALSLVKFGNGPVVPRWSIYSLDLTSGQTTVLVAPRDGVDAGNPAAGRAGNRYIVYDAVQAATGASSIIVLDLFSGQAAEVAVAPQGYANPAFLVDESGITYSAQDPNAEATEHSLFKQDLSEDRLHKRGDPTLWYQDANLGVIYRRGAFHATNVLPTVALQLSADQVAVPATVTLTATATDADGTIDRVEFYEGSTKLAQADVQPYTFVWRNVPPGNHLLIARAVDNLGGSKDSSARFLTVTGNGSGSKPPTVSLQISSDSITLPESVTFTATASDTDGSITHVAFYDGSTRLGLVNTAPYSFVWRNASPGNHLVTARALDNLGAETTSSPRLLTVTGEAQDNKPPSVSLTLSADKIPAQGSVTLTAAASDADGTIARVEFYDQQTKLGQVETPPYAYNWQNVPAGNHLLVARAIDNLGAKMDSSPRFLTVNGTTPGDNRPKFEISPIDKGKVRLTVSGPPGYHIISMSEDLKNWVDIYPVTIEASGVGSIDDSTGLTSSRLFFKVRREP